MTKRSRFTDKGENRVWYLLLKVGVPSIAFDFSIERHFAVVRKACDQIKVKVRPFEVTYDSGGYRGSRYLFRFLYYKRDDDRALRFAESHLHAMAITSGPVFDPTDPSVILRIPTDMVRDREHITLMDLVELEESRYGIDRTVEFPMSIGTATHTTHDRHEAAWRITPLIFQDQNLFKATGFLKSSQDDFYIFPGELADVLAEPELTPRTGSDQSRFENALQNAFKAIEAIIGEPPKRDEKFFLKLKAIGLNPFERVAVDWDTEEPLCMVIRNMNRARDKKAAHGSTSERTITVKELFNYQRCAHRVVVAALENQLGEPIN